MTEEIKDANIVEDPSLQPDVDTESSPEAPAEATAQQAEQKEVPFHEHPRWQEIQREKQEVQEEKDYWRNKAMEFAEKVTAPKQVEMPTEDDYANMDAETEKFYRNLDARYEKRMKKFAEEVSRPILEENRIIKQRLAEMWQKDFRRENPDVKPGSEEERLIASKVKQGYSLEDAAFLVMGPKRIKEAEAKGQAKKAVKTEEKMKANIETSSIPRVSGLPTERKRSFRETLDDNLKKAGF